MMPRAGAGDLGECDALPFSGQLHFVWWPPNQIDSLVMWVCDVTRY